MESSTARLPEDVERAVAEGRHPNPFAVLGMHAANGTIVVRAMVPHANRLDVIDAATDAVAATLACIDPRGYFAAVVPGRRTRFRYRLRLTIGTWSAEFEDPYRFGLILGDLDIQLLGEGSHRRAYDVLGAHLRAFDGVEGASFAVWAPNASRVSVVGDFNDWDGRRHVMRRRDAGVWEIFVPGVIAGARYKYELLGADGRLLPLKADPYAFAAERPPATASVVATPGKRTWTDSAWSARRAASDRRADAIAIYEVHLGSWRRGEHNRYLTYDELSEALIPYVAELGFTHIELMPVAEHPFDGSWGYQPTALFAPTARFGAPSDFARFVERAHEAGIGVIVDWVPAHFPGDDHGLVRFDGTALYEHADRRQGFQPEWNTFVYNYGRREVANFLLANALFWFDVYHVDGLRVDAVSSMLYLDYARRPGEWVPNRYGGRENLDAIALLRHVNEEVCGTYDGALTIAEESTAWPGVTAPAADGGLGFGLKWNMGWMHDTLGYVTRPPADRQYHQDEFTFPFVYASSERFVLPLSHDEVVYGKGSLLGKLPGDESQRFATLRALLAYCVAHPGKKLLFMGSELAQGREWNHDRSLDWHVLETERHRGVWALVGAANALYRREPALHRLDADPAGVEWIVSDRDACIVAFARRSDDRGVVVAACNFSSATQERYRLGVPAGGWYRELLNTDDGRYGGNGIVNPALPSEAVEMHEKAASVVLTLPALTTILLGWSPSSG